SCSVSDRNGHGQLESNHGSRPFAQSCWYSSVPPKTARWPSHWKKLKPTATRRATNARKGSDRTPASAAGSPKGIRAKAKQITQKRAIIMTALRDMGGSQFEIENWSR